MPGTEPTAFDTWTVGGRVVLPAEYAERIGMGAGVGIGGAPTHRLASMRSQPGESSGPAQRILSPADGDEYELPPGVDRRYATLALSATPGADGRLPVWYIDGRPHRDARWRIEAGRHVIRAVWQGGGEDEVVVVVR